VSAGLLIAVRKGGQGTISPCAICSTANATAPPKIMLFSQLTCHLFGNFFLKAVVTTPNAVGTRKHAIQPPLSIFLISAVIKIYVS
jgi:hypothetical protein